MLFGLEYIFYYYLFLILAVLYIISEGALFLVVRNRFKVSCITFYTVWNGLSFSEMWARADPGLTRTRPQGPGPAKLGEGQPRPIHGQSRPCRSLSCSPVFTSHTSDVQGLAQPKNPSFGLALLDSGLAKQWPGLSKWLGLGSSSGQGFLLTIVQILFNTLIRLPVVQDTPKKDSN